MIMSNISYMIWCWRHSGLYRKPRLLGRTNTIFKWQVSVDFRERGRKSRGSHRRSLRFTLIINVVSDLTPHIIVIGCLWIEFFIRQHDSGWWRKSCLLALWGEASNLPYEWYYHDHNMHTLLLFCIHPPPVQCIRICPARFESSEFPKTPGKRGRRSSLKKLALGESTTTVK